MRVMALAFLFLGCASPQKIEEGANAHMERAREYQAQGDYYRASKERAAAQKQYNKANQRASYYYGYY